MNIDTTNILHIDKKYKCYNYCNGRLFKTFLGHFSLNTKTNSLFFHYDGNMGGFIVGKPPVSTEDYTIFEVVEEV